jgi:membrane protein YqaA with SNARE-associated domain
MDPVLAFVFGSVAGGVIGFLFGKKIQKDNDKPVMILNENEPHAKKFLHHIHPHDLKEA